MNHYTTALFDLDGTLLATKRGVIGSVKKTFKELGIAVSPDKNLDSFMGPPLLQCFTDVCGLSKERAEEAMVVYRRIYEAGGMFEADVYEGIENLLGCLKNKGIRLGVATSKSHRLSLVVLEHFGLLKFFDAVGGTPDNAMDWTKKDSIISAMKNISGSDKSNTVLVGDRMFDAAGATEAEIRSIGVLYGYGSEKEIRSSGFCAVVKNVEELKTAICLPW